MLRMYFIANWFNLADEVCEEFLYDSVSAREFCKFDLGNEPIPDATTLENFRHLLEQHQLGEQLFAAIGGLLQSAGLKLTSGTIVDATIIAAPSSTKNKDKARDNRRKSKVRARVEHTFLWIKRICGFTKARHRG